MTRSSSAAAAKPILDAEIVASLDEMLAAPELARLLGRAEEQLTAVDTTLRQAWQRADLPAVTKTAHQLVGLAGTVACSALAEIAQKIETAGGAAQRDQLPALFLSLDATLAQSLAAVGAWRGRKTA